MLKLSLLIEPDGENFLINGKLREPISNGCYRTVYKYKTYVIKIESLFGGGDGFHTMNEVKVWNEVKDTKDAKFFVPVLAYKLKKDFAYIVQPYVRETTKEYQVWHRETIREVVNRHKLVDIECGHYDEPHNWMVTTKGIPVIYDYAH